MIENTEVLQNHIPSYLSKNDKEKLLENLKSFKSGNYYSDYPTEEYLQGDGWFGLEIFSFYTNEKKPVTAIALTNSCDIEQKGNLPTKIVFSPIIKLEKYIQTLKASKMTEDKINSFLLNLKNQNITNLFFLPANGAIQEDSLVDLSDIHSQPLSIFLEKNEKEKQRIFRLSQMGHYLFLLKISIHFCRFWENVERDQTLKAGS